MADKKIPQLDAASQINSDALFAVSQQVSGAQKTLKGTVGQVGEYIGGEQTFSGLNTTSKKLIGAINEIAQGGGGSGGHTILDNEGDALTQRSNLQFKGAYSKDDSANSRTEVNVVRSMTKAEFDLLPADEKVGFINITDVTGGNDDRFQPVIYSEDEREIGVWLDGKPLYEKTFLTPQGVTMPQYQWVDTGCDLPDAEQIIWSHFAAGVSEISGIADIKTNENYSIYAMNMRNITVTLYKFTVQYTKTTDTAGSGQWTPQGVPAHHYSTDEQIVGTWIDGSTLYEKTLTLAPTDIKDGTYQKYFDIPISNIDSVISADIKLIDSISATKYQLPYVNTPRVYIGYFIPVPDTTYQRIQLRYGEDITSNYFNGGIVTLRYTKSTS